MYLFAGLIICFSVSDSIFIFYSSWFNGTSLIRLLCDSLFVEAVWQHQRQKCQKPAGNLRPSAEKDSQAAVVLALGPVIALGIGASEFLLRFANLVQIRLIFNTHCKGNKCIQFICIAHCGLVLTFVNHNHGICRPLAPNAVEGCVVVAIRVYRGRCRPPQRCGCGRRLCGWWI